MPSLSRITGTFFVDLINRLGVRPAPPEAFLLSNVVQPVTIVDSGVAIQAVQTTQTLQGAFSTGKQAAPGAGVLLADTGQLAAGIWSFFIMVGSVNGAGGTDYVIERRNAANAANIWRQIGSQVTAGMGFNQFSFTSRIETNERVRVETDTGGAGTIECNIFATQIS